MTVDAAPRVLWFTEREYASLQAFLSLRPRQQQVALLVARGLSRPEIAGVLSIEVETVRQHMTLIHAAFGPCYLLDSRTSNRSGQIALARELIRVARAVRREELMRLD